MTDGSAPPARHRHDDDPDEVLWDPADIDAASSSVDGAPDEGPSAAADPGTIDGAAGPSAPDAPRDGPPA